MMNRLAGNLVNGTWIRPSLSRTTGLIEVQDPGDLSKGILASYPWSLRLVEQSVRAARDAFPAWRSTPQAERELILRRAQEGFRTRRGELANAISLEMGKPIQQARIEVDAMIAKFDIVLPDAERLVTPHQHPDESRTWVRGEPKGVVAVIGPFNFPGHLVNGMVLPALATGNTVILKPASITPGVWRIASEIFQEAGLPAGVLNYVLGDSRVGKRLARHPLVDLLLFTGGVTAGRAIKRLAAGTHKEVKLEMGGQGAALVLPDASIELAAQAVVLGSTIRGGQNCNSTRSVLVVGHATMERLREAVQAKLAGLRIGPQSEEGIAYGPLAVDPAKGFRTDLAAVLEHGGEILFEGTLPAGLPHGYYAPPILYSRPKESLGHEGTKEVFGPALSLVEVPSAEEGLALMNLLRLRLSAAVHSQDVVAAEAIARQLRWGQVVINEPTVGASSKADFAGMGEATYGGSGGRAMTAHTVTLVNLIRQG